MVTYAERHKGLGSRAPRLRGEQRRTLLEEAAARLFAEHGYDATTTEQIVAAAGVSKPMLYRHFESKRDLFIKLIERRRDELAAAPLDVLTEGDGNMVQRLPQIIDAWFEHVQEHPDTCRMLLRDAMGDPEIEAVQHELRSRQRAADVALLREFAPGLPEAELQPLGEIIRSSLAGLALWWLDEHPDLPRANLVAATLRLTRGLLATVDQPHRPEP